MRGDPGQKVSQPGLRVDAVHLGRDDEAVHGRGPLTTSVGAAKHPRLSPQSDAAQRALGGIVKGHAARGAATSVELSAMATYR